MYGYGVALLGELLGLSVSTICVGVGAPDGIVLLVTGFETEILVGCPDGSAV
jgi:hypothetical protein